MQCFRKSETLLHQTYSRWLRNKQRTRWSVVRCLFSKTGDWDELFTTKTRKELEAYWKDRINKPFRSRSEVNQKYYVLSMFPYPSGNLHMGHVRVYTISDTMARYHKMRDRQVLHPMGWDAFGLPAENAAIERGERPDEWTFSNIANMKKQLIDLGLNFDWETEYATCDPEYYKWTQYIFLKMYEAGLVYQKEAQVNWDPVDNTVLADEQIDENGCSWRSGAKAEKRFLTQWYIKTTAYAKSLYDGLSDVNPDLWRDIIDLQKHWIGECTGTHFHFQIQDSDGNHVDTIDIFTDQPELIFGVSHILLSPEHKLTDKMNDTAGSMKLNLYAVNPFSREKIPVYLSKTHEFGEFTSAYLGIPSSNGDDKIFAETHNLPYNTVIEDDTDTLVNSKQFSGSCRKDAFEQVTRYAKEHGFGGHISSAKLRDWLISRQRYWGTPIPMIHCKNCGPVPVPYEQLPVKLPKILKLTGKGGSPLADAKDWLVVPCPRCKSESQRETDTMDTFVDSSWYYLRYIDPQNPELPFSPDKAKQMMPVDLYIGGKEHAIMHLYYARFFNHFLNDAGMLSHREPFVNLLTQGMVMGKTYRLKSTGEYLKNEDVEIKGKKAFQKGTGAVVKMDWEKMSKSKHNGVDPQEVLNEYGVDSTRLCILSSVAPKTNRNWSNETFVGILRWQKRIWSLLSNFRSMRSSQPPVSLSADEITKYEQDLASNRNFYTKEITFHYEKTFLLNVAVSRLQAFSTFLKKMPDELVGNSLEYERTLRTFLILLAPLAPSFCAELWRGLHSTSHMADDHKEEQELFSVTWPQVDQDYKLPFIVKRHEAVIFEAEFTRAEIENMTVEEAFSKAKSHPKYENSVAKFKICDIEYIVETGFEGTLRFSVDYDIRHADNSEPLPMKKTVTRIV